MTMPDLAIGQEQRQRFLRDRNVDRIYLLTSCIVERATERSVGHSAPDVPQPAVQKSRSVNLLQLVPLHARDGPPCNPPQKPGRVCGRRLMMPAEAIPFV